MSPLEGFIRDTDVREMRQFRRERLIHRCTVIAVTNTRGALGFEPTEMVVAEDVWCLYMPSAQSVRAELSGDDVAVGVALVEFDHGVDVRPNHRLYITGVSNGIPFAKRVGVTSVNEPRSVGIGLKAGVTDDAAVAGAGPPPAP